MTIFHPCIFFSSSGTTKHIISSSPQPNESKYHSKIVQTLQRPTTNVHTYNQECVCVIPIMAITNTFKLRKEKNSHKTPHTALKIIKTVLYLLYKLIILFMCLGTFFVGTM